MLAATMLGLVLGSVAPADGVDISWTGPPSCPGRDRLRAEVDALLAAAGVEPRALTARATVEPAGKGFVLTLTIDGETAGERRLEATRCDELVRTAALIIAMTIDPRVLESPAPAEPADPPEPTEPMVPAPSVDADDPTAPVEGPDVRPHADAAATPPDGGGPSSTAPPVAPRRKRPTLRFVGRVGAGLGFGPLPALGATLAVAAGVAGRSFRVEIVATYAPPVEADADRTPDATVRAQLWAVGARGCGVPSIGRVDFPLCAGLDVGQVLASAIGTPIDQRARSPWVAAVAGPGVAWWVIPRLAVGLRFDGHVALLRPDFEIVPSGRAHLAAPAGFSLLGGILVRAP